MSSFKELISEMDSVLDELKKAQDAVHVELLATKVAWLQRAFRQWHVFFPKKISDVGFRLGS